MIRPAVPGDEAVIHDLIVGLAVYEREPDAVLATVDDLRRDLFAPDPAVFCHLAIDDDSGVAVGMALWFRNYSTWLGKHGIWLEDLFVVPEARGKGYGLALLRELGRICVERGYGRLEWWVLDWNEPALKFYRALGARPMDAWTVQRLTGDDLNRLGSV